MKFVALLCCKAASWNALIECHSCTIHLKTWSSLFKTTGHEKCKGMEVKFHAFLMISFSVTLLLAYFPPHTSLQSTRNLKYFKGKHEQQMMYACIYVQGIMPGVYLSVCRSIYLPIHTSDRSSICPLSTILHHWGPSNLISSRTGWWAVHDITSINTFCKIHEMIHISTWAEMCIISECCSINTGKQWLNVFLTLLLPHFSSSNILCTPCFLNEMLLYFTCRCLLSLQLVKWDSSFTEQDKGKSWKNKKSDFHSWHNQKFFSFRRPDWLWNPPSPLQNGHYSSSFGVKWPGHEANHSPPTTAKVKKAWNNTFTSLYFFMARLFINPWDNFTISLYLELKILHKHEIHIQRSHMNTSSIGVHATVQLKTNEFQIYIKWLRGQTFSAASETVRTKVENTGLGWVAVAGQHSTDDPIGRQNIGTVAGNGKFV